MNGLGWVLGVVDLIQIGLGWFLDVRRVIRLLKLMI